jgi:hypothetical protein
MASLMSTVALIALLTSWWARGPLWRVPCRLVEDEEGAVIGVPWDVARDGEEGEGSVGDDEGVAACEAAGVAVGVVARAGTVASVPSRQVHCVWVASAHLRQAKD